MAKGDEFTTKFKVDVSDLKKGIKEANQQMKLANAQFKASTAGMDDWTKSAEGIRAKLSQLDSVLAAQKNKLSAYQTELQRNQQAYEQNGRRADELRAKLQELASQGVSKTSAEYKKYEAELAAAEKEQERNKEAIDRLNIEILKEQANIGATEKEIGKYTTSLEELEKGSDEAAKETDKLGESVEDTGEKTNKASGVFDTMEVALGNLVASGIQMAVKALKDMADAAVKAWEAFDEGRDVVIRLTGATGEFAAQMTTAYANVSKLIVADSTDIGKAIGEVQTRFGLTGDALESFALRYLQFSEITESDVIKAIDDTQKALSAYGLNINSAKKLLDALAATSQKTGVDTDTLTKGLISNATAFQEMGLSIEQSVAFMGMLEKSGANSETVLNGMRKALKNATNDGKDLSTALTELENDILNNTDSTKGLQAAYDVFGKSGDQIYGAVKNGSLSFRDIATAAKDASGAVENTFSATKDATDDVKLTLQNLKSTVAEIIDKYIQQNGDKITQLLDQLSGDGMPKIVDALTKIGDALVWVSDHYDTVASASKGIVDALTLPWRLLLLYNEKAMKALVEGWEKFVPWITEKWQKIKAAFTEAPQWFKQKFTQAWESIKGAWNTVTQWFGSVWSSVKNTFSNVGSWFSEKFTEAWTNIKNAFSNFGSFFSNLWESVKTKFSALGTKIGDAISGAVKSGINGIISRIENIINNAIGLINGAIKLINMIPGVSIGSLNRLSLPRLEQGGILRKGQIGLLEGTGAEAVVPLDQNKKWISAVASDMLSKLNGSTVNNIKNNSYNFTQVINAPKAPSRIELYRQTRNLLAYAKEGV